MLSKPLIVAKGWGHEEVNWNQGYCSKRMVLRPNKRCSWHVHLLKDEVFRVEAGSMSIEFDFDVDVSKAESLLLIPGDVFHVPPGLYHRFTGLGENDCIFYESSTHDYEDDSIRIIPGDRLFPAGNILLRLNPAVPRNG